MARETKTYTTAFTSELGKTDTRQEHARTTTTVRANTDLVKSLVRWIAK